MNRISDMLASGYLARHCTEPRCGKCIARARWYRRKARRACKPRKRATIGSEAQ